MAKTPKTFKNHAEMVNHKMKIPQVGRTDSPESHTIPVVCPTDSEEGKNSPNSHHNYKLILATYNARSIASEARLIELEQELKRIKWEILGISEVRKQGEEYITLKSGNILDYKGNDNDTYAGVGFIIKKKYENDILKIVGISGRVAYIIIRINKRYNIKVVQLYAPTSVSEDDEIEEFYDDVSKSLDQDKTHFNIILGDINAKVDKKEAPEETCIGNYGISEQNPRGQLLVNFALQNNMYIMNTFHNKKTQNKWTWRSPNGLVKNEIDFVITNNRSIIKDVSVLNQFTTSSDHRLVKTKIQINTIKERIKLVQVQ